MGGGGSFVVPTFQLTDYGQGGWNSQSDYKAVYHNGNTYIGWVASNGDVRIGTVPDSTGVMVNIFTLHAALEIDTHVSPSILVRDSDKRLMVFYSQHNGAALYMRISTNPESTSAWDAEVNLDSQIGGSQYTYPSVFQLLGRTNDPIVLMYRDRPGGGTDTALCYTSTTDHDASPTWSGQTIIVQETEMMYWKVLGETGPSGVRIDIALIDGHPVTDAPTKLYHMYGDATDWHKTDGTVILSGFPLGPTDMTEVYNGASGSAWIFNVAMDGSNPVIAYQAGTYQSGAEDTIYARWNGSAWVNTTIRSADGPAPVYVAGGSVVDEGDPRVAYVIGYDGAEWEAFRYETADSGATFGTPEQLTSGSAKPAHHAATVRNRGSLVKAIWLRGDVEENDFTLRIEGTTS
jgi:hypothetical protein